MQRVFGSKFVRLLIVVLFVLTYYYVMREDTFTHYDYEKLNRGMTVKEVSRVLHVEGNVLYENTRSDGTVISSVSWTNQDGATIDAIFENGKLRETSHRGLQ